MWIEIALPNIFYAPVILWSAQYLLLGMLMIPKTRTYGGGFDFLPGFALFEQVGPEKVEGMLQLKIQFYRIVAGLPI
jgi:hypothetical protein